MNYTEQLENATWQWNELDDDFDFSVTVDFLNSSDSFRTFGDGLIALILNKYPDAYENNIISYLKTISKENGVETDEFASRNTLKNWFEGDKRPKKGETDREHMFALAFALNFNVDETAELFHKVYLDRAFDFRNEKELVYYFCLANGKKWTDAKRIISLIEHAEIDSDETVFTLHIKAEVDTYTEESQLLDYIKNHRHNLEQTNKTAKKHLGELLEKAKLFAVNEAELPQNKDAYEGKWKNRETASNNFLYEVITEVSPSSNKGTTTVFANARLPKEIKNRFPEAASFSEKEPTYESMRKMIILLFSYEFWGKLQWGDITQTPPKKFDIDEIDVLDEYIAQLNALLNECGLPLLYYGNPFDWMFLYCAKTINPLDMFRDMIAMVLTEE